VESKRYLGSSGKVVMVFREPIRWSGPPVEDWDAAFRYIYPLTDFEDFLSANRAARERRGDFHPACLQVYCEGGAMRKMGWNENYDYLSVFFKDVPFGKAGRDLPHVQRAVESEILSRIENREAFVASVLLTPRDLKERFYFPEGNIDHMELGENQTYFARGFSPVPEKHFYQFGRNESVFYCGAGSYPCGSVAGTPGYMAATQWLRG
jgi:phytoene dehydrogenase-like protein